MPRFRSGVGFLLRLALSASLLIMVLVTVISFYRH